jgi:hypothetical protein
MNSTAFSLLANSSAEFDENQEMELTIGSLNILIGPSGSSRLSDSMKPDPSASKPETEVMLESSEGSSSEVNSPVNLGKAPIAEGDKIQEKFDLEERACKTHNSTRDFAVGSSGVSKKVHQLCVIITEVEEENNNEGSKRVDRQVDKVKEHNKREKEKVHVSAREWRMITSAINHGTEVPEGSRREVLMGYQYALYQHRKKLREERDMLFQGNNSMSKEEYWDDYSEDSEYSRERHGDPKHNRGATTQSRQEKVFKKYYSTARGRGRRLCARNTRSSADSSTGIFTNHTARTRRSVGRHAPSRNTKPWDSGRQDQGKRSRDKLHKLQGKAKGEVQSQYNTKRI